MKTHLTICNEADYLQAHLTFIVNKPRPVKPVFHDLKERVASLLKKWIMRREKITGPFGGPDPGIAAGSAGSPEPDPP
jgi:hypothetical protein